MQEFLEAQAGIRHGMPGWWDRVLPNLTDEQLASLMDAARSAEIRHQAIATVLGRWGYTVTSAQVGHWRRNYVY
jgi:hypothetical protein